MWLTLKNEVRKQHALFDRQIGQWLGDYAHRGGRIFCGKGCRECCNLAVNASFTEALCIAEGLTDDRAGKVRAHAGRLLEHVRGITDLKSYLRMHREIMGFCPLLDEERSCTAYEVRPFSCRALLSTMESRICGLDFATISPSEKLAFIAGLDISVVSFPMHYVAATQDLGQELENRAARRMAKRFGFSLYGSLAFLIYLELEHRLSKVLPKGYEATTRLLEKEGLNVPFLVMLDRGEATP
jgi:Fe-S-cluster containining protein